MYKLKYPLLSLAVGAALLSAQLNATTINSVPLKRQLGIPNLALKTVVAPTEEMVSGLMVTPRQSAGSKLGLALRAHDASALAKRGGIGMRVARQMSGGAHVIKLDAPVTLSAARAIAARLMQDRTVELVEPDRLLRAAATTPTDPAYAGSQWHYFAPAGANHGGANLPVAWDTTLGSAAITVAVLDTGYRQHADLAAVLPGYDFITDSTRANDGGGRDADAQDPGDWEALNECSASSAASNSSWHGTHVAGIIAALMNNGIGGTGVAPNVKLLPVRVLGKCGGLSSDIIDGMRWAAGLYSIPGVGANPNPVHILNMSLGGSGACSAALQSAVSDVVAAGKTIIAPTGNAGANGVEYPANCSGVIAVTAHAIDGDNASYSNIGAATTISAPGGGCGTLASGCTKYVSGNGLGVYSIWNSGTTTPAADSYAVSAGTSSAVAHVSGVVALMLSVNAGLTPTQIKSYLQASARPHPASTLCVQSSYLGLCGAGLLDATQAVNAAVNLPPIVSLANFYQTTTEGQSVALAGIVTTGANPVSSYAWSAAAANPAVVALSNASLPNASFTPTVTGTYVFTLTVTDSAGKTGNAIATIKVNPAPAPVAAPASGGGGGSMQPFGLLALALLTLFVRTYRTRKA